MSQKLQCQVCDYTESIPIHCNQPMHIEKIEGTVKLVCWMGPECGVQALPFHHDRPMRTEDTEED